MERQESDAYSDAGLHQGSSSDKSRSTMLCAAASIGTLPQDVIREIFIHCLPLEHFALMDTSQAPLLLCRICSSWRQIAMGTPHLWSSIHVPYVNHYATTPRDFSQSWKRRLSQISAWLSRSGSLPLSISTYSLYTNSLDHNEISLSIIKLLISFSARWKHIHIESTIAVTHLSPLCDLTAKDLPLLESFSLILSVDVAQPITINGILEVPTLRSVTLCVSADNTVLPYQRLQSLQITFMGYNGEDLLAYLPPIFTQSPNLVELRLTMRSTSAEIRRRIQEIPRASLPQLQSLEVWTESGTIELLSHFQDLPKLKYLLFKTTVESMRTGLLRNLFERLPQLESLVLTYAALPMDELIDGLRSQTALTSLTIANTTDKKRARQATLQLLKALTAQATQNQEALLLPRLQRFTHINSVVKDRHYVKFLRSRASPTNNHHTDYDVSLLMHVKIKFQRSQTVDLFSLSSGAGRDLRLEIEYPPSHDHFMSSMGLPVKQKGFELDFARGQMETDDSDGSDGGTGIDIN